MVKDQIEEMQQILQQMSEQLHENANKGIELNESLLDLRQAMNLNETANHGVERQYSEPADMAAQFGGQGQVQHLEERVEQVNLRLENLELNIGDTIHRAVDRSEQQTSRAPTRRPESSASQLRGGADDFEERMKRLEQKVFKL